MENSSIIRDNEIAVLTEAVEKLETKIEDFRISGPNVSGNVRHGFIIGSSGDNGPSGPKESSCILSITPQTGTVLTLFSFILAVVGDGVNIPTGTVTMSPIPVTFTLDSSGQVIFVSTLVVGTYPFSFTYSGDANYLPSSSGIVTVIVTLATATVSINIFPNPAETTDPVTFQTTVTGQNGVVPTGTVTIYPWGTVHPLTNGSFTETLLVVEGTYNVYFHYNGDGNYLPADSRTVILVVQHTALLTPTIAVTTDPAQPIPPNLPFSVTFIVSGSGGTPTGQCSGYFGDVVMANQTLDSSGQTTWHFNFEYVGIYYLQCFYHGDSVYNPATHNEYVEVSYGAGASTPDFPAAIGISGDALPDYQYAFRISFGARPPNGQVQIGILNPAFTLVNCAGGQFGDATQLILAGGSPPVAGVYVYNPVGFIWYTFNIPENNELDLVLTTQGSASFIQAAACAAVAAVQLALLNINGDPIPINGQSSLTTIAVLSPPWGG